MAGHFNKEIASLRVLDCRFSQEYEGGHIKGAQNVTSFDMLNRMFKEDMQTEGRHVTVFYCEFSKHRGPSMFVLSFFFLSFFFLFSFFFLSLFF